MKDKVKVGIAQFSMQIGNKQGNEKKALERIVQLAEAGCDIILLPELFSTEYFPAERDVKYFAYAMEENDEIVQEIQTIAKRFEISILLPIFEREGKGFYYNSTFFINPQGEIAGKYRKVHIPAVKSIEKYYFRPGSHLPVFETDWGKFGCLTCHDRFYPEAFRVLALKGADVIFVANAAGNYADFSKMWEPMLMTRAYENGCFIVCSNRVGSENETTFFGKSAVFAPSGDVLTIAGEKEENICAEIDLKQIEQMRNLLHIYRDYRPEMYREICSFEQ